MKNAEQAEERKFLDRINATELKGIAILLVLLGHLKIIKFAGAYGVAIFLILSGFGLTQSYLKSGTKDFLTKRLDKVLFPYFIVTLVWFIMDFFLYERTYDVVTIIKTLSGLDPTSPIDPSMWYITFLLIWYIAFYLIFSLPLKNIIKVILISLATLLIYQLRHKFSGNSGMQIYIIEFPVGVLIGFVYHRLTKIKKPYLNLLFLGTMIISTIVFNHFFNLIGKGLIYYSIATFSCAMAIISFFSILASLKYKFISIFTWVFRKFGEISYEIYLLEMIIMIRYNKIYSHAPNEIVKFIIFLIVATLWAIILREAVKIIREILSRVYNKIILLRTKYLSKDITTLKSK